MYYYIYIIISLFFVYIQSGNKTFYLFDYYIIILYILYLL